MLLVGMIISTPTNIVAEGDRRRGVAPINVLFNLNPRNLAHALQLGFSIIPIIAAKTLSDNVKVGVDIVPLS